MDTAPTLSNALTIAGPALVAWWSYRRHLLTGSGAWAALGVGTATFAGGAAPTVALLLFFFSSALVFRVTRSTRASGSLVAEQSAARNAYQVLAVGALPAVAAVSARITGDVHLLWGSLCALAFATSDTWATDVGQTSSAWPRLLGFGSRVPAGQSGGVTWRGTLAGAVGAAVIASAGAVVVPGNFHLWCVVAGVGWAGSHIDSLLGALAQSRGTCAVCGNATEKRRHCGQDTVRIRRGLSNEGVNLATSAVTLWLGLVLA